MLFNKAAHDRVALEAKKQGLENERESILATAKELPEVAAVQKSRGEYVSAYRTAAREYDELTGRKGGAKRAELDEFLKTAERAAAAAERNARAGTQGRAPSDEDLDNAARMAFANSILGKRLDGRPLPDVAVDNFVALEMAKRKHARGKAAAAKALKEKAEALALENLASGGQPTSGDQKAAREFAGSAVFQELVAHDAEELQRAEIEGWPPKQKSRWQKMTGWYFKQNRFARIAISTGILTLGVAAFGTVGAVTAAGIAGTWLTRMTRSLVSGTLGDFAGGLAEKITMRRGQKTQDAREADVLSEFTREAGSRDGNAMAGLLKKYEGRYAKALEGREQIARRARRNRIIAAIAVGAGSAFAWEATTAEAQTTGGASPATETAGGTAGDLTTVRPGEGFWHRIRGQIVEKDDAGVAWERYDDQARKLVEADVLRAAKLGATDANGRHFDILSTWIKTPGKHVEVVFDEHGNATGVKFDGVYGVDTMPAPGAGGAAGQAAAEHAKTVSEEIQAGELPYPNKTLIRTPNPFAENGIVPTVPEGQWWNITPEALFAHTQRLAKYLGIGEELDVARLQGVRMNKFLDHIPDGEKGLAAVKAGKRMVFDTRMGELSHAITEGDLRLKAAIKHLGIERSVDQMTFQQMMRSHGGKIMAELARMEKR